jgi:hypothetical protein
VVRVVGTLDKFSAATGLLINQEKSGAYWWSRRPSQRPAWTNQFRWQWIGEGEVSKLLGTPFGLFLRADQVDEFLLERVENQLKYWTTTRMNSTGRGVICNGVLNSATIYFLAIWGGTLWGVKQVEAKIRNFF